MQSQLALACAAMMLRVFISQAEGYDVTLTTQELAEQELGSIFTSLLLYVKRALALQKTEDCDCDCDCDTPSPVYVLVIGNLPEAILGDADTAKSDNPAAAAAGGSQSKH